MEAWALKIQKLKQDRNAVILAHNYQRPEIQDLADFTGDSLGLSRQAQATDAAVIVFCGVHFMAETASILNPGKQVLLPDLAAGCSMADMVSADWVADWKAGHPGGLVVSYVNTTAAVKAESDICCTSSNAREVVASLPAGPEILFLPDKFLGRWVSEQTGRKLTLFEGWCPIHQEIRPYAVEAAMARHPEAWVAAHPEAPLGVRKLARLVASTEGMIEACRQAPAKAFIIATETGILHKLRKTLPDRLFYAAEDTAVCPYMKRTTLERVAACLEGLKPEIKVPEAIRERAFLPIQRMLDLGLPYNDNQGGVGCKC
jgi:quinolinate synthase